MDARAGKTGGLGFGPAFARRWTAEHPDAWLNIIGAVIGLATAVGAILFDAGLVWTEHRAAEWQERLQHAPQLA